MRSSGVRHDAGRVDGQTFQLVLQAPSLGIFADDANDMDVAAERHDVAGHVRGPAKPELLAVELHDWDRRFGRNPRDASVHEVVQHQVADNEDGPAGHPVEQRVERGHRQAACEGCRSAGAVAGARSAA